MGSDPAVLAQGDAMKRWMCKYGPWLGFVVLIGWPVAFVIGIWIGANQHHRGPVLRLIVERGYVECLPDGGVIFRNIDFIGIVTLDPAASTKAISILCGERS